MIRTFFDSGVLIAAARSVGPDRERALRLLEGPNRVFLTSPFVYLEVVPKAIFFRKQVERSIADIELAKGIASKRGIGYQTVLKQAIRKGLKRAG
jgi:predicted nucleic acid-binding protein